MELVMYDKKYNVLYINSNALDRRFESRKKSLEYCRKPILERIELSPYKEQIEAEIKKHEGCELSEFLEGPSLGG